MKKHASTIAVGIFAALWFGLGFYWLMSQPKHGVMVIDCSLAEISPDFTTEIREACRKARSGRL